MPPVLYQLRQVPQLAEAREGGWYGSHAVSTPSWINTNQRYLQPIASLEQSRNPSCPSNTFSSHREHAGGKRGPDCGCCCSCCCWSDLPVSSPSPAPWSTATAAALLRKCPLLSLAPACVPPGLDTSAASACCGEASCVSAASSAAVAVRCMTSTAWPAAALAACASSSGPGWSSAAPAASAGASSSAGLAAGPARSWLVR